MDGVRPRFQCASSTVLAKWSRSLSSKQVHVITLGLYWEQVQLLTYSDLVLMGSISVDDNLHPDDVKMQV